MGFLGDNLVSSKVDSRAKSGDYLNLRLLGRADLVPLSMIPPGAPFQGNSIIRVRTDRSKGRGFIQDQPVLYRYGKHRRLRVLWETHWKGQGASGIALNGHQGVINTPRQHWGRVVGYTAAAELQAEGWAVDAGLFHPSTVALAQLDQVFGPDDKVMNVSDAQLDSGAPAGPFYSIARGWEDGTRIWELTASVWSAINYTGPLFFDLNPANELLYAIRHHQTLRDHARAKVDGYLDRCRDIRERSGRVIGLGVAFRMTPQELRLTGEQRYRAYLGAFREQIYEQLIRTVKSGLALKPWAFHLANISISGEFSGFDRLMQASGDVRRVRSGIVCALADTYGAYNYLSIAVAGKMIPFDEFFQGFQRRLKGADINDEALKQALLADSYEALVGRGVMRGRQDYPEIYPFSKRVDGDVREFEETMRVFFGSLQEIYNGSIVSDYDLFNRMPRSASGNYLSDMTDHFNLLMFGGVHSDHETLFQKRIDGFRERTYFYRCGEINAVIETAQNNGLRGVQALRDLAGRLDSILQSNPDNAFARIDRGRVLYALAWLDRIRGYAHLGQSKRDIGIYLAQFPDDQMAANDLVSVLICLGELERAIRILFEFDWNSPLTMLTYAQQLLNQVGYPSAAEIVGQRIKELEAHPERDGARLAAAQSQVLTVK
ncbi:MAG: hypothetical protein WCG06_05030, partial [Candidatus Omnitrophota bacterium]